MTKTTNASVTRGTHHVGLTVRSLDAARHFFVRTLGYQQIGEIPDYPAVFLSDGTATVTLWQASNPASAAAFDRKRAIGLHHLALKVEGDEGLDSLYERLKGDAEVEVEFPPEHLNGGPTRHMMCSIPGGGIRVEFVAA